MGGKGGQNAKPTSASVGLGICRNFRRFSPVWWASNLLWTILLGKCVCQLQRVCIYVVFGLCLWTPLREFCSPGFLCPPYLVVVVVVVVVRTSPSGAAYMGDRCPEEMRNSTRLS